MRDRLAQMEEAQRRALKYYGQVPPTSSIDHLMMVGYQLRKQLDAETRHVTLSHSGLAQSLTKVFVEALCVLRARDLELQNGTRKKAPSSASGVCRMLREEIFAPKNEMYDDTFGDCGAVGVVIRLLDQVLKLKRHFLNEPVEITVAHIANYAVMAIMLLIEDNENFLT